MVVQEFGIGDRVRVKSNGSRPIQGEVRDVQYFNPYPRYMIGTEGGEIYSVNTSPYDLYLRQHRGIKRMAFQIIGSQATIEKIAEA